MRFRKVCWRIQRWLEGRFRRPLIALALFVSFVAVAPCGYADRAGKLLEEAKNVDLLALVVWHEARGEPAAGKTLIAETVLERVRDQRWPNTIEGVLTQTDQFQHFDISEKPSPWAAGWADCMKAARAAMRAGPSAANHFHSVSVTPAWHDPSKVVLRSGGHVFLRL